ncbi:hypothetical protein PIB30_075914 [Stylosanthes scabra]|uniref:Uncharacterized protein n=1 Tax=Stylosanthes scabra TaxID=79078 RepID=A0ABU6VPV5_9FABA|nr:hypothetical protein [Stylosanthes scabra]
MAQEQARTSPMMLHFRKSHKMHGGGDKLRVAANGASIGAPDQKLSRPEAADEQWRIDWESILNRFSLNFNV